MAACLRLIAFTRADQRLRERRQLLQQTEAQVARAVDKLHLVLLSRLAKHLVRNSVTNFRKKAQALVASAMTYIVISAHRSTRQ